MDYVVLQLWSISPLTVLMLCSLLWFRCFSSSCPVYSHDTPNYQVKPLGLPSLSLPLFQCISAYCTKPVVLYPASSQGYKYTESFKLKLFQSSYITSKHKRLIHPSHKVTPPNPKCWEHRLQAKSSYKTITTLEKKSRPSWREFIAAYWSWESFKQQYICKCFHCCLFWEGTWVLRSEITF